jgi:ABC-2 type transport system permease protein
VDRILIALKFTMLAHSSKGLRGAGWVFGALFVAATWACAVLAADDGVRSGVLALLFACWAAGAAVGPVLLSGSGVLRPDYFALLPVSGRRLSRGLLVSVFVSVAAGFVLLAFAAAAVHAVQLAPAALVVVLVGAPLSWVFAITCSRLLYGLLGAAMRSKVGVEIAGIQFGLLFAGWFTGWMIVQTAVESVPELLRTGLPDGPITAALGAFPTSWPLAAVEAAAAGDPAGAALPLAALAALDGVPVLATVAVLTPRTDVPARRRRGRPRSTGLVAGRGLLPATQLGAVIGKEYRQWTRDPWRSLELRTGVWTGLAIGAIALVSGTYAPLAAFAGLIVAFMMSICSLNLYGQDGTAVWQSVVGQDATSVRSDVRGRQWAIVLVGLPHALLISVVFILLTREFWVVPFVVAALPAVFGAACGAGVLLSAIAVSPGVDPRRRVGPNDANGNVGVQVWIALLIMVAATLPTTAVLFANALSPAPWLTAATVAVGMADGWFAAWLLGRIAIAYLGERLPDVYSRIRYGRIFRTDDGTDSFGVLTSIENLTLLAEQRLVAQRQKERDDRMAARRGS